MRGRSVFVPGRVTVQYTKMISKNVYRCDGPLFKFRLIVNYTNRYGADGPRTLLTRGSRTTRQHVSAKHLSYVQEIPAVSEKKVPMRP